MRFQEFMQRLGLELKVPDLAPNPEGACAINLDGMTLSFYSDPDEAFTVMCPLGVVGPDDLAMQEALLAGNLFADGVGGSALGMNGAGQVYLSQRFHPAELSFARFFSSLERFANLAEYWKRCLTNRTLPQFAH